MKKRSLIIFVALALVPLILLAQISSPGSYASVIMTFLRSTTAAAARSAIGAANSGSGGALTNAVIYGSTSGSLAVDSIGKTTISTSGLLLQVGDTASPSYLQFSGTRSMMGYWGSGIDGTRIQGPSGKGISFGVNHNTWGSGTVGGITSGGLFGVGTIVPEKALDVNSATGACLQLTYNDSDGSAANKVTFDVSSGGDLTVAPSGLDASFTGRLASTPTSSTLAAAATAIAVTANVMTITGDAGANTVATITGGLSGQILTLIFADSLVTITDDATGTANTVNLSAAFTSTSNDTLTLVFNGTSWREVSRSVN